MIYDKNGVYIKAKTIDIGERVSFGKNVDIRCIEDFILGDRSHLGDDVRIRGRRVVIGDDLYHSRGLDVGGGGCDRSLSTLVIGDRCTIHNNHLNIAETIVIGNDVGLSPEVTLYTHGFWLSVLRGFPAEFAPILIENGAIIGYRTTVMAGVTIGENCVVGAQSVVTKNLDGNAIYAGVPAKKIRDIKEPSIVEKRAMLEHIVREYMTVAAYHKISPEIWAQYPNVHINECVFNVETLEWEGKEDECTDDWRDHARRYGLRYYSERPFRSALKW